MAGGSRLRKLRTRPSERVLGGKEYEARLRAQSASLDGAAH